MLLRERTKLTPRQSWAFAVLLCPRACCARRGKSTAQILCPDGSTEEEGISPTGRPALLRRTKPGHGPGRDYRYADFFFGEENDGRGFRLRRPALLRRTKPGHGPGRGYRYADFLFGEKKRGYADFFFLGRTMEDQGVTASKTRTKSTSK